MQCTIMRRYTADMYHRKWNTYTKLDDYTFGNSNTHRRRAAEGKPAAAHLMFVHHGTTKRFQWGPLSMSMSGNQSFVCLLNNTFAEHGHYRTVADSMKCVFVCVRSALDASDTEYFSHGLATMWAFVLIWLWSARTDEHALMALLNLCMCLLVLC